MRFLGRIKTFKENTTVIIMLFVFARKVVVIKIIVSLDPLYSRNVNIASQKRKLKSRQKDNGRAIKKWYIVER